MRVRILCLLVLFVAADGFAAKKDYKGLFGSYRREKFTENEGRASDWGMDIMLSTLLPLTSIVNSTESTGTPATPMYYASFFNVEGSVFTRFSYNWEVFLGLGYYSYSTRKQNSTTAAGAAAGTPQFQLFELTAYPILLGAKYRFGTSDIVPYVGGGAGVVYTHRRTTYDYVTQPYDDTFGVSFAAQATAGFEFFISPRAGIRLETSAMFMGLGTKTYDPAGSIPIVTYQANPIAVRYSSGLFLLF